MRERAVLVTGASGLVGTAVAQALDGAGWSVRGVDRAPGRWTTVVGDLRDRDVRRAALRRADTVVHAAARHAPHVGRVDDGEFHDVNVEATRSLHSGAAAAAFGYRPVHDVRALLRPPDDQEAT